jgi:hypothetical protein
MNWICCCYYYYYTFHMSIVSLKFNVELPLQSNFVQSPLHNPFYVLTEGGQRTSLTNIVIFITVSQTIDVAQKGAIITRNVIFINSRQGLCSFNTHSLLSRYLKCRYFSWCPNFYNKKLNPNYYIILIFVKFCDVNCNISVSFVSSCCSNIHF